MADLSAAIAAAREAFSAHRSNGMSHMAAESLGYLIAALDAARGQAVAWGVRDETGEIAGCVSAAEWAYPKGTPTYTVPLYAAPPAAVFKSTAKRVAALQARDAAQAPPAAAVPAGYVPVSALIEARDHVEDWAAYSSPYFQEKHDLAGVLAEIDAQIAQAQQPAAAVREGYALVPVEPTEAMLNAARDWSLKKYGQAVGNDGARGCYAAMLAAAERAQGECPHAARCDCLGGCKRGMRGNGAVEVKP